MHQQPLAEPVFQRPLIDKSQIEHFLRLLIRDDKWATIQTFTDREGKPSPDPLAKVFTVSRITRPVLDKYVDGAGIWVTINETNGKGRKKADIVRVRAVWQEDDDGFEGEFPLEPSLVIETSPGHFHRYWFVEGAWPADEQGHKDFAGVMARMIASYGSDPGAKDISRVLRLPGFLHRKNPDDPHLVRIVGGCRRRYSRAQILEAFPPPVKTPPPPGSNGHARDGESETHAELVRQVLTGEHYHPALCALAYRLVGSGMPTRQVEEQLRGMMLARPREEQDDRWKARFAQIPELVRTAEAKKSANGHAQTEWPDPVPLPHGLLPVTPFKYDMLPEKVQGRVEDIVERMQCAPELVAIPTVVALGTVIGRKVAVRPKEKDSWDEVGNIWGLDVAPPGWMKSPAYKEATSSLRALEAAARDAFKDEMAKFKIGLKEKKTEEDDKPVQRRYIAQNINAEALAKLLTENPNGVVNMRDELMALLRLLDDPMQSEARGLYLSGWNGTSDYNVDRIMRGLDNYIPACTLSMFGCTQPAMISRYIHELRQGRRGNDGLLQRFALATWPDMPTGWTNVDRHPNATARNIAAQVFKKLDEMTAESVGAKQEKIGDKPVGIPYFRFCPDAQKSFTEWHGKLELRLRTGDWGDELLKEHVSKYRGLVPKLALICHLADWDQTAGPAGPISVAAIQKSLRWVEYLETHAARIYASGNVAVVEAAHAIIAKVKSGHLLKDGFRSHDVWRPQWSRLRDRDTVMAALKLLEDYDWASSKKLETGGREATVYTINPKALA
jgi:hypothetical protein